MWGALLCIVLSPFVIHALVLFGKRYVLGWKGLHFSRASETTTDRFWGWAVRHSRLANFVTGERVFIPHVALMHGHLQTMACALMRQFVPTLRWRRQVIDAADGSVIVLDWCDGEVCEDDDRGVTSTSDASHDSSSDYYSDDDNSDDGDDEKQHQQGEFVRQRRSTMRSRRRTEQTRARSHSRQRRRRGHHSQQRTKPAQSSAVPKDIILVLHGLSGSSQSNYIQQFVRYCVNGRRDDDDDNNSNECDGRTRRWRCCVMHARGCAKPAEDVERRRFTRTFDAGFTDDLDSTVRFINEHVREPGAKFIIVGFSMGANVATKWLGEVGESGRKLVDGCMAVCCPFDNFRGSSYFEGGKVNRVLYSTHLLSGVKELVQRWKKPLQRAFPHLDMGHVMASTTVREFDTRFVVPLYGYADADDYYRKSSSAPYVHKIAVPYLSLTAMDDPICADFNVPVHTRNEHVAFLRSEYGGHLGFFEINSSGGPSFADIVARDFADSIREFEDM